MIISLVFTGVAGISSPFLISSISAAERLRLHQPGISPFPGDEILMPSLLYYPSPIYDEDPVSIHHSAQPMSDHDGGATLSPFHQSLFDCPLVLCIQAGGGLIQDKYGRSLKKSSGDGDPLSLSAAETNSPLSHQGIITLGRVVIKS